MTSKKILGRVSALWRYPVKSMAGEELNRCEITPRGLLGDRAYALVDEATGLIGSAKNPRAWPDLLSYRAAFVETPQVGKPLPPVRIAMPGGQDIDLATAFGRRVGLSASPPEQPILEQFWPVLDATGEERVTNERMPPSSFFDLAVVNVLLTTTLDRLAAAYPQGRFDMRRFRPNIVITPEPTATADPEAAVVGQTLCLGDAVRLHVDSRCARCVMTTLAHGGMTKDTDILRTVIRANDGFVGLNSSVAQAGVIAVGDRVWFTDS